MNEVVVRRAVGFTADGYVAEVAVDCRDGVTVVRGEASTVDFAVAKAAAAARSKLSARKRAAGFAADGLRETTSAASFDVGFARAA